MPILEHFPQNLNNRYICTYIYSIVDVQVGEAALCDFFLNQEEIPGNHQMLAEMCRKSPTYKLWVLLRYDMRGP